MKETAEMVIEDKRSDVCEYAEESFGDDRLDLQDALDLWSALIDYAETRRQAIRDDIAREATR